MNRKFRNWLVARSIINRYIAQIQLIYTLRTKMILKIVRSHLRYLHKLCLSTQRDFFIIFAIKQKALITKHYFLFLVYFFTFDEA
jgi:hypothetical protein